MARPLRIAIAVHGRFHAFDVARTLSELGHEVTVFTNYPQSRTKRYGIGHLKVVSFLPHLAMNQAIARLRAPRIAERTEPLLHKWFGGWAKVQLTKQRWDVVNLYSGIAEETLRAPRCATAFLMERGSTHIRAQAQILQEEAERTGYPQEQPSTWMIAREEREYQLTDHITLLSSFARETFQQQGFPLEKVSVIPLGVNAAHFRASPETVDARCQRIMRGDPLHVLYVGRVCFRKGFWDHVRIMQSLNNERFRFTLVGSVLPEVEGLREHLPTSNIAFFGHQPQTELFPWYSKGDLFFLPTIEDGFAMVLSQAQANGLPIIATTNCSAPDFLEKGKSGWIVPIRQSAHTVEILEWCDSHRAELADMVRYTYQNPVVRDWMEVGRDYQALMYKLAKD